MLMTFFYVLNKHQNVHDFLKRIDKWHPNLRFTKEEKSNDKLAFLDVLVIRDNCYTIVINVGSIN